MRKRILSVLSFVLGVTLLAGCMGEAPVEEVSDVADEKVKVAATIYPVYDIVKNVAGEDIEVVLILPPGASPHTFDFTPSDLTKLQGVKKVFAVGYELDSWSYRIADNVPGLEVIELDSGIDLIKYDEEHEEDHEHVHGEYDPHYWLDPDNAVAMAEQIADELGEMDSVNAEEYRQNADLFKMELESKNVQWQTTLESISSRDIVTFHDAYGYFADHFNLNIPTTFEPFPGKEPTPSYLEELEHEIEEYEVKALFTEPQLYASSLEQFAKDHGINVYDLDPLGGVDGRDSYIDMIDYNVSTISEALK